MTRIVETIAPDDIQALSRRNFLKVGLGALGALAALELGGAGFMYLRARSEEGDFGGVITAGAVEKFPPGSVTEYPESHLFVIRAPDGGFLAVYSRCPHLGCTVSWVPEGNHFICPCHASSFDFFGTFESPPVPRSLDTFDIQIDEDGVLKVDTSHLHQRERFSPDQLAYA